MVDERLAWARCGFWVSRESVRNGYSADSSALYTDDRLQQLSDVIDQWDTAGLERWGEDKQFIGTVQYATRSGTIMRDFIPESVYFSVLHGFVLSWLRASTENGRLLSPFGHLGLRFRSFFADTQLKAIASLIGS